MKLIRLSGLKSSQYFTLVDDSDFEWLNQFRWHINTSGYAVRNGKYINGKRKPIRMNRFIMDCPKGLEVDHINGNPLDNRRENLRICTRAENRHNISIYSSNKSGFKGVHFKKREGKYASHISFNKKRIWLGYFDDPQEAAKTYNQAAIKYHGEYAKLNDLGGIT